LIIGLKKSLHLSTNVISFSAFLASSKGLPAEKSHRFKGRHDAKKEQYGQIYVEKFTSASLICKAFYGKMKT